LGAVLREMLAGREHPRALSAAVARATADDPAARYTSAQEVAQDLAWFQHPPEAAPFSAAARGTLGGAAALLIAFGIWFAIRQRHIHWARDVAMPEVARLADRETHNAAMLLARQALEYLPGDPALLDLWNRVSADINIETDPPGATVEVKD